MTYEPSIDPVKIYRLNLGCTETLRIAALWGSRIESTSPDSGEIILSVLSTEVTRIFSG